MHATKAQAFTLIKLLYDTLQVYLLTVLKGLKHRLAAGISLLFFFLSF